MFSSISRLLKFLRKSFEIQYSSNGNSTKNNQDEHQFQAAVINGIGKCFQTQKENFNYCFLCWIN